MNSLLAEVQAAVLVSVFKPIFFTVVLGGWAWVVSHLDKDLEYYYLPRRLWNGVQMACAGAAFGLWLVIPIFWLGLLVALLLLVGGIASYVTFRNAKVPPHARWTLSMESLRQAMSDRDHARAQRQAGVTFMTPVGVKLEVPAGEDPLVPAHAKLTEVMEFALPRGADRVDIAAGADKAVVVVHIDGVKYPLNEGVDSRLGITLIDYLKDHAGLDVSDRRRKQSGDAHIEADDFGRHRLGVSTVGSSREVRAAIQIDPDKQFSADFDTLGLLDAQKAQLRDVISKSGRVVLASCPPGEGLTTTLYSLTQEHDPYMQSIVTLEDDVALALEGVTQETVPADADIKKVNEKLTQMLRQDPQVFMIPRIVDASTAALISDASEDVRFYVGLQMPDTFKALRAWVKAVGDGRAAGQSLGAIVAQRLVRKLCITCRVAYQPDADALRKMNLPPSKVSQLYKESGKVMVKDKPQTCPACLGMAFRGREAVFEVMIIDDQARELIAAGQLDQLRGHLRKQRMLWLQEAGIAKAVEGVTSISEITRALGQSKKK